MFFNYTLDKAIDLVGDLSTYSINVRELKCFFSSLQRTQDRKWVKFYWLFIIKHKTYILFF